MRTTLDIADDVLFAAKDYARRDKKTLGEVISEWGRAALASNPAPANTNDKVKPASADAVRREKLAQLGIRPFPKRAGVRVTNEHINQLRDELGV
jgi:hypothetical protein